MRCHISEYHTMEILWKFLVIAQLISTIWGYFVMEAEAETTTLRPAGLSTMPHKITDCPPGQLDDCQGGYEEYYLEHSVSQKDAKKSLKESIENSAKSKLIFIFFDFRPYYI